MSAWKSPTINIPSRRPLEGLHSVILIGALRTFVVHGVDVTGEAREHCALVLDELEWRAVHGEAISSTSSTSSAAADANE